MHLAILIFLRCLKQIWGFTYKFEIFPGKLCIIRGVTALLQGG